MWRLLPLLLPALVMICISPARADDLDPDILAKVQAKLPEIQRWAADPVIVQAVEAQNATPPPAVAAMTQERWKTLSVLDPAVRAFTRNEVGRFLKAKKGDVVCEAFVSTADGKKVGFLAKTTNWSHAGKPKHEEPMKGQTWRGPLEVDESTGVRQVQVAVPILSDGKVIGSLVIGLDVEKLRS